MGTLRSIEEKTEPLRTIALFLTLLILWTPCCIAVSHRNNRHLVDANRVHRNRGARDYNENEPEVDTNDIRSNLNHLYNHHHYSDQDNRVSGNQQRHNNNYNNEVRSHRAAADHRYHYQISENEGERNILQRELRLEVFPSNQVHVDAGREAVLSCKVLGDPAARITWTKVGGRLPESASAGQDGYLVIRDVDQSDQGTYVCTATTSQSKEAAIELFVDRGSAGQVTESAEFGGGRQRFQCGPDESTCRNGECVKRVNLCDGEYDCRDRSDELHCGPPAGGGESIGGRCEPNEFKCDNSRCVQKMWVCDSEDDCGDRSDERTCGARAPGDPCAPTEFKCQTRDQCVPKNYHCDGQNDCQDGSDEVGCAPPTVVEPPARSVEVCLAETITIHCRATGVPVPHISWRLNWGHVCDPPRCVQTSVNGFGTLTISNAGDQDQGAYSCEAINVKGRVLAVPDAIVTVKNCRPQTKCHTDGTASQDRGTCVCKAYATGPSCDQCAENAFYLAPSNPQGCIRCFCMGITKTCHSSNYFRTQERIVFSYDNQGVAVSDLNERNVDQTRGDLSLLRGSLSLDGSGSGETLYWKMPNRLAGNKLTAYGGKLKFMFQYSGGGGQPVNDPLVVLKGNEITLIYQGPRSFPPEQSNEVVIDMFESSWNREDGQEATREHFLMTLAGLDSFLIRATHSQGQTRSSLGEVVLDVAVETDTQQLQASAVEQCMCPEGYQGLSCEECAPGYERSGGGLYLGTCVKAGDNGGQCNADGSVSTRPDASGRCECKEYVTGPNCNQCKTHAYYLTKDHPSGCIPCFCSGVTKDCDSSNFYRSQERLSLDQSQGLALRTSDPSSYFTSRSKPLVDGQRQLSVQDFGDVPRGKALYLELPRQFVGNKVTSYGGFIKVSFRCSGDGSPDQHPDVIIRGNDISLHYKPKTEIQSGQDAKINAQLYEHNWIREDGYESTREHLLMTLADLNTILIKVTCFEQTSQFNLIDLTMDYAVPHQGSSERALAVEQCRCPPGYIGTSCEDCASGYTRTGGGLYLGLCERCQCHGHSETCDPEFGDCIDCQHNTYGPKCNLCKPGFVGDATRGTPHDCQPEGAPRCTQCQCYNHSPRGCDDSCRCVRCEHNTEGTNCELCKAGFYGDARQGTPYDCKPCPCPGARECYLDHTGQPVCKSCPPGYFGPQCKDCDEGYSKDVYDPSRCTPIGHPFAVRVDPDRQDVEEGASTSFRCTSQHPQARLSWYGPNNNLPSGSYERGGELLLYNVRHEDSGAYKCLGVLPNGQTATGYGALTVRPRDEPFTVRIAEPKHVQVEEGKPVSFRCEVVGRPSQPVRLSWSKVGSQSLPREAYESGGTLTFYNAKSTDSGNYQCVGTIPSGQSAQDEAMLNVAPKAIDHREPLRVRILDPKQIEVDEGGTATLRCEAVNKREHNPRITWSRVGHPDLPQESQAHNGVLVLYNTNRDDSGPYTCHGSIPGEDASDEGYITVKPRDEPFQVRVKPPKSQRIRENTPSVQFECEVVGQHSKPYTLVWSRPSHPSLPAGSRDHEGQLTMYNLKKESAGKYLCTGTNSAGDISSDDATLDVEPGGGLMPQPIVTPKVQTVRPGEPVEILCQSSGDPPPIIQWGFKNPADPLRHGVEQDDGRMRIESAQSADAGEYFCTASNVHGTVSEPATVHVDSGPTPPKVQIVPKEKKLDPGENFEFVCTATGSPEPQIVWSEEEKATLDSNIRDDGSGRLVVQGAKEHNAGRYVCTASNLAGEDRDTAVLKVGAGDLIVRTDPKGDEGGKITIPYEDPVKIECIAEVSPGMPKPEVQWIYDIGPSRGDLPDGYTPVETHGRFISHNAVTEHNEGRYTCRATSGNITKEVTIEVDVLPRQKREVVIQGPQERHVTPGESLTLKCDMKKGADDDDDDPAGHETELKWFRVDGPMPDSADQPAPGTLRIDRFEADQAGAYECRIVDPNDEEKVLGSRRVKIVAGGSHVDDAHDAHDGQVIIDGPEIQAIEIGDELMLKCSLAGSDQPNGLRNVELKWAHKYKDKPSKPVVANGGLTLSGGVLSIDSVQSRHAGLYTCHAETTDGRPAGQSARVNVVVSFTERDAVRKRIVSGSDAEIECPIHRVEGMSFNWVRLRNALPEKFTADGHILKVSNFQAEDSGVYECEATINEANALGYVDLISQEPDVVQLFMEVEPDYVTLGNDVMFKCVVEGDDDASVRWEKGEGELPLRSKIDGNTLTIMGVRTEDTGIYRCVASTKAGPMTTDVVLQIGSKILTNILRRYFRARRRYHHVNYHRN